MPTAVPLDWLATAALRWAFVWNPDWAAAWAPQWRAELVPVVSYGCAALAFLLLAIVLLAGRRPRTRVLTLACLLTVLWAAACAATGLGDWRGGMLAGALSATTPAALSAAVSATLPEILRTAGWLSLLLSLSWEWRRWPWWLSGVAALAVLQLLLAVAGAWPAGIALRLALAVLGMLLVEQVYRGAERGARWSIKFSCFGIGAMFAYDFYLYSDALLFHRVHPDLWAARGMVNAVSVPLLMAAATRDPARMPRLLLSRQMLFGSAALLGSALYLLAMAASAWYLRYVGGAWGTLMQLACLFGAVLLLAAILFSGAVRARLKIFIGKHFFHGRYDYREEWQRFTRGLAEDGGPLPERVIQALAGLVESPAGVLWLRGDDDCYRPAAGWNMPAGTSSEAADSALCRFLHERGWVVEMSEWRVAPQRYGNLALPSWLTDTPSLWLVVPLMLERGLFAFVCLARPRSALQLNWEVRDVLKIAGSQAGSYLAHRASADGLAVARQFESFNRMSTFVVHDLKNLVSQISLLLVNAERHRANPAFQADMLETLGHSVDKMQHLLRRLRRDNAPEQAAPLALDGLLVRAVDGWRAAQPRPTLELAAHGLRVLAERQRLERVIGHLLQNAIEATPRDGSVTLRLARSGNHAVLELCDSGHGMTADFIRDRLFKPFESTKTAGMGIGVFESREYVREIGGRLEVASAPSSGTTFRLTLPLADALADVVADALADGRATPPETPLETPLATPQLPAAQTIGEQHGQE